MPLLPHLTDPAQVLIAGASQGIGLALCRLLLERGDVARVWAVSRQASRSAALQVLADRYGPRVIRLDCDARDESALAAVAAAVTEHSAHLNLVVCTLGILHQQGARAEKSLAQLDLAGLQATFNSNAFAPILLLKHLLPLLRKHPATFAALSARVGSIDDNHLGGWYSYRASKAALNQLLRSASIELKRLNPQATVLSLHPGTTDTALSAPFQSNVPAEQLFTPAYTAQRLLERIAEHGPEDSGSFWAWDGQRIEW
ncbi:SDR family NAD(P)-dependent oxidoreductase [Pseudomonas sp.]|uniref:SDR family NAD(P)-dependent oxidoreductase n=1 Tax=Pseudomonas sp. TaxID=306 RepID=UPI0028A98DBB|nr:SDR family NAD(P)-dependent oxidoreductase [Pseudomonas sp.]